MSKYILRLDDACEKMNCENWTRMELLLDKYGVKPLVGVIPHCEDTEMDKYAKDPEFWDKVHSWIMKGWSIAMHGYNHVYSTNLGGLNPINKRSEFAGVPLHIQNEKISHAISIMKKHDIEPKVFFAPAHTFDENTIIALKENSNIRIISDTIANKPYNKYGMMFVPQQSGKVRKLPFSIVTFCYHPNVMKENDFNELECFLKKYRVWFIEFPEIYTERKFSMYDKLLKGLYFIRR